MKTAIFAYYAFDGFVLGVVTILTVCAVITSKVLCLSVPYCVYIGVLFWDGTHAMQAEGLQYCEFVERPGAKLLKMTLETNLMRS